MSTKLNTNSSKVTASTGSNPGYAIDPTGATIWYSTVSPAQWVKYDFTDATLIHQMSFLPIDGNRIKDFKCQGSNNDVDWTDLLSTQHPDSLTETTYTLTSTGSYRYYRFYISSKWGSGNVACTKWSLLQDAINITVLPSLLTMTETVQAPTILLVFSVTITPSFLELIGGIQTPLFIGQIVTILPNVLSASLLLQMPTELWNSSVNPSILNLTSNIYSPILTGVEYVKNATKIISFNPLVIIMGDDPLMIGKVDTTDPENPTTEIFSYPEVSTATDAVYNAILGKIFVSCADGKILAIDSSDFSSYVVYDTGDLNNLTHIVALSDFLKIYAATDLSSGEIIVLDDATTSVLNTDIRWQQTVSNILNLNFNTTNGEMFDTDMRWKATIASILGCDIRFLTTSLEEAETPISRLDFHVYLDNIELTDVQMDSINIYHTESEKSKASFTLARQHDNLNYTLENTLSQITNNNAVRVEINRHVEFNGYIWNIDANSDSETVQITAYTDDPKADERSLVTISIPAVNERLQLYHALIHNPQIENPRILADDQNPPFYKGVTVDMGYDETQNISRWRSFENVTTRARTLYESKEDLAADGLTPFIPKQNWTYFWFALAENFITGEKFGTMRYIGTSPTSLTSDTWAITGLAYNYQRQFESKKVRLGTTTMYASDYTDAQVAAGAPVGAISGKTVDNLRMRLALTAGGRSTLWQDILSIMDNKLGYNIGSAPYKKVSSKAGILRVVDQWVDNPDGVYVHRDESYDYRNYVQQIAALEYQKIQNINGTVLPKTSATIELFIDGYYYHNIALLKRINIDNTVCPNIYNNLNGFPLSVKHIEINSGTMKVSLQCNNQWSKLEMEEIEANYPNPDSSSYLFPEENYLQAYKFDPRTLGNIQ